MSFQLANKYKSVFLFLFSREQYISDAVEHGMAINLEAPDLRRNYEEGNFPKPGWEAEAREHALLAAHQLSKGLWGSFWFIAAVSLIACVIAYINGTIDPKLAIDPSKGISFAGTFLASWGTLMELGGGFQTWKRKALHELIHPVIFKILFIPGVCLLLLGIVL